MRPNIDIPWSIHGRIKDYAQTHNVTMEQAYRDILETGISHSPIPEELDTELTEVADHEDSFGPIQITHNGHISTGLTFSPTNLSFYHGAKYFESIGSSVFELEELDSVLTGLEQTLSDSRNIDWFTVHQSGGAWYGQGIENFLHVLQNSYERWDTTDFTIYSSEPAFYVRELWDDEYLILEINQETHSDDDRVELRVSFVTNGTPVNDSFYTDIGSQFNLTRFSPAKPLKHRRKNKNFDDPISVQTVDEILIENRFGDSILCGVVVDNPFKEQPKLLEEIWEDVPRGIEKTIGAYDRIWCRVTEGGRSESNEYGLVTASVTNLGEGATREGLYNLYAGVHPVEIL